MWASRTRRRVQALPSAWGMEWAASSAGQLHGRPVTPSRPHTSAMLLGLACLMWVSTGAAQQWHAGSMRWGGDPAKQLLDCYTRHAEPVEGATFKAFLDGKNPWLRLHKVLWSQKQPCASAAAAGSLNAGSPDPCPLTVATTLTLSRMDGLERLCSSWPGPLVAALYVPVEQDEAVMGLTGENSRKLEDALQAATALFARMEEQNGRVCALRLLVMYEVLSEHAMHLLLPINSLRNAALLAAATPLVAMIDVDLMLSATLGQQLVTGPPQDVSARAQELVSRCVQDRSLFILPAFEPHTRRRVGPWQLLAWADKSIAGDKAQLLAMIEASEMCFFQELSYPRGHRLTDFPRWHNTSEPYRVEWRMFYEPWFLVGRMHNPWYDVRFQGYGYNKQNHVAGLAIGGFKFMVHPGAFVVHRPHNKTHVQRLYVVALNARAKIERQGERVRLPSGFDSGDTLNTSEIGTLLQHRVKKVFLDNMALMKVGMYTPQVDQPTKDCLAALPWWRGASIPAGGQPAGLPRGAAWEMALTTRRPGNRLARHQ